MMPLHPDTREAIKALVVIAMLLAFLSMCSTGSLAGEGGFTVYSLKINGDIVSLLQTPCIAKAKAQQGWRTAQFRIGRKIIMACWRLDRGSDLVIITDEHGRNFAWPRAAFSVDRNV